MHTSTVYVCRGAEEAGWGLGRVGGGGNIISFLRSKGGKGDLQAVAKNSVRLLLLPHRSLLLVSSLLHSA